MVWNNVYGDCLKGLTPTHSSDFSKMYLLVLSMMMRAAHLDGPLSLPLLWLFATGQYWEMVVPSCSSLLLILSVKVVLAVLMLWGPVRRMGFSSRDSCAATEQLICLQLWALSIVDNYSQCLFIFLRVFFTEQKLYDLIKSNLPIFFTLGCVFLCVF